MKRYLLLFATIAVLFTACDKTKNKNGDNENTNNNTEMSNDTIASTPQSPFEGSWVEVLQLIETNAGYLDLEFDNGPFDSERYSLSLNKDTIFFSKNGDHDVAMMYIGTYEEATNDEVSNFLINDSNSWQYFKANVTTSFAEETNETFYFALHLDQDHLLHTRWFFESMGETLGLANREITLFNTKDVNQKWPSFIKPLVDKHLQEYDEYPEISEEILYTAIAAYCSSSNLVNLVNYSNNSYDNDNYIKVNQTHYLKEHDVYDVKIDNDNSGIYTEVRYMTRACPTPDHPYDAVCLFGVLDKFNRNSKDISQTLNWYEYDAEDYTVRRVELAMPNFPNPTNAPYEYSFNTKDCGITVQIIGGESYQFVWNDKEFELKK